MRNLKQGALAAMLVLAISGCGTTVIPRDTATYEEFNSPALETIVSKQTGVQMVVAGSRKTAYGIELISNVQSERIPGSGCYYTINQGTYHLFGNPQNSNDQCFSIPSMGITNKEGQASALCTHNIPGYLCKRSDESYYVLQKILASIYNEDLIGQDLDKIKEGQYIVPDPDNFMQELIYNGRTGDQVQLLYREFSGDMRKPDFLQIILHDLTKSDLVRFKSLILKIHDATDTSITYEVQQNFAGKAGS